MKKKLFTVLLFSTFLLHINAETSFSGCAGGKVDFSFDNTSAIANPDFGDAVNLKLQAFFASQFNFSQNLWSHLEFSIDTTDLITDQVFKKTPANFLLNELSLILRAPVLDSSNYLSVYLGTYDPIGSDIFLRRYMNSEPFASRLADGWQGLSNNILYPHWGIGISDIIKLNTLPIAFGGYAYVNHENNGDNENFFQPVLDFRFAGMLRYFIFDISGGIGTPIVSNADDEHIFAIDKINSHFGTTILIGNNYSPFALFFQGGIYNIEFTATTFKPDDIYLLLEPRFQINKTNIHLSIFSFPQKTINELFFVDTGLGLDLNIFAEKIFLFNNEVSFGSHFSFGFENKNIGTIIDESINNQMNFASYTTALNFGIAPYFSTRFLGGELNFQMKIQLMKLPTWDNPLSLDIGFKTQF